MNERKELVTVEEIVEGVRCYEKDGVAYLNLEDVARGLGFTDNSKSVPYVRWNVVRQYLEEIGFSQEVAKIDFIPENIFYRLAMKAKNEVAEAFQAKVADEIIPAIRRHGSYSVGQSRTTSKSFIEQGINIVKFIADDLNVNEASRLLMYENYCKDVGVPTGFIPKYEHNGSREMKAPSHLLKENGCELSVLKFNALLVENGYLEDRERPSRKGGMKKYKALTDKGLEYGENAVNPHNQREVQPLYYSDKFMELYNLIAM